MWAVMYDDGTSLTTASERIARSLAEAERQRGRRVTVRHSDDVETYPRGMEEPADPPGRARGDGAVRPAETGKPSVPDPSRAVMGTGSEPEPAPVPELTQVPGPTQAAAPTQAAEPASVPEPASEASPPELTREPEPARAAAPARRRRLLLYALAGASIVVAAALVDHWGVLPRVGASTSSSPTQISGFSHGPQLLPPLDQPPVMHFGIARGG